MLHYFNKISNNVVWCGGVKLGEENLQKDIYIYINIWGQQIYLNSLIPIQTTAFRYPYKVHHNILI